MKHPLHLDLLSQLVSNLPVMGVKPTIDMGNRIIWELPGNRLTAAEWNFCSYPVGGPTIQGSHALEYSYGVYPSTGVINTLQRSQTRQ